MSVAGHEPSAVVVERFDSATEVARAGAELFVRVAGEAIAARGRFSVALAGGSTPRRMLAELAAEPLRGRVDWSRVVFFFGDERPVPPDHPDSNFRMASEALLSHLDLREDQVHRMRGESRDPAGAAEDYEAILRRVLGASDPTALPRLDLVYLGMGEDGHTASLFPGTRALGEQRRLVVANAAPHLSTTRITFTFPLLAEAREVVFIVCGRSKAARLAEVFEQIRGGDDDRDALPAARVRPRSGGLRWLIDASAAGGLPAARE